ncbi:heterokaryon incompatibility protein-domain-containing protein [Xylaria scruposa]|nr:heterokaryon incompatibility protein-domain-containing protein [Xylaria scruposa]
MNSNFDSTRGSPTEKDPEWIDINQVKAWIYGCNTRHEAHCHPIRKNDITPCWLIDTGEARIVRPTTSVTYVALSYVWGSTTSGLTCQGNLEELQKPGSLLGPAMPRTIRDVISVLHLLGERYLWVDRLCIIQDDDKDKEKNIDNMAAIYSNACMTLVVAIGDDTDHGLRGISGITPALDPEKRSSIQPSPATEHQLTRLNGVPASKWYSRGWTLQEIVFSRRVLYFTEAGAFWECHCYTWSEDTRLLWSKCNEKLANIFRDSYFPSWPNLHMYLQLVAAYNNRQLTFDDDILAAFAGITTSLTSTFQGGFLFGLPEIFLDVALLWRPMGPCRRRISGENGQKTRNKPGAAFPSWSWIGWQTEVDPQSWKCGYDYIKSTNVVSWPGSKYDRTLKAGSSWKLKSTIQWYVADGPSSPTRPVISDYKRHQRSGDTPAGWSRYSLPSEGPEEAEFVHLSDMKTRFHFPLPLPSDKDTSRPSIQEGSFLFCQTTRAYFLMEPLPPDRIVTSLFDESGTWAGVVRMQVEEEEFVRPDTEKDITELPEPRKGGSGLQKEEFIAISEGSAQNSWNEVGFLEEWSFAERPRDTPVYDFFNVLCIMRQDGICYRKGVGRVLKNANAARYGMPTSFSVDYHASLHSPSRVMKYKVGPRPCLAGIAGNDDLCLIWPRDWERMIFRLALTRTPKPGSRLIVDWNTGSEVLITLKNAEDAVLRPYSRIDIVTRVYIAANSKDPYTRSTS